MRKHLLIEVIMLFLITSRTSPQIQLLSKRRLSCFLFIGLMAAVALTGCGVAQKSSTNLSHARQELSGSNQVVKQSIPREPYRLEMEQVVKSTVFTGIDQEPAISGKEVKGVSNVLNGAAAYDGPISEEYYRMIELTFKDGTKYRLFINRSGVFTIEQQHYMLSDERFEKLKTLVKDAEASKAVPDIEVVIKEQPAIFYPENLNVPIDSKILEGLNKKKAELAKPATGLFQTVLVVNRSKDKVDLQFSLINKSEQDQKISFGSGQQFEITAVNEQGKEIYRWSYNKSFTMALIEKAMKKEDKLIFSETWDYVDNEGEPIPNGTYRLQVQILANLITEKGSKIIADAEMQAATSIIVNR